MMRKKWYVLYTSPRAEKQVLTKLESIGVECYLPLHRCPRVWSDRVKLVDIPLFNSYIFVKCKDHELFPLTQIRGIVRVVFYNGSPAVIRQPEIDAIKRFLEEASEKILCTGDEVEILTGLMKRKSGRIVKIRKKYMVLHIEQLSVSVWVNIDNVAPLKRF